MRKGAVVCKLNSIREDYLEEYIFNRINEVVNQPRVFNELLETIQLSK